MELAAAAREDYEFEPNIGGLTFSALPMREDGYAVSGCESSSPDTLPDGVWYGFVIRWDETEVDFDLACYIHPKSWRYEVILEASLASGKVPTLKDVVYNKDEHIRTLPLAIDTAFYLTGIGADTSKAYGYDRVADRLKHESFWIYVNGGEVTDVVFAERASRK
jgi:hypothetical protein